MFRMFKKMSALTILLLYSPINYAAQWTVDGDIRQEIAYDDNVRMAIIPRGSIEYKLTPSASFAYKTDTSVVQGSASYGIQRYFSMKNLDRSIQNYKLSGNYATERSNWGIAASMTVAPSRNTAVEDSGNFSSNSQKTMLNVSPSVSYSVTELDSLKLSAGYSQITFSTTEFSNSQSSRLNLAWQRQWSERYSSSISASYSTFQSSNLSSNTELDSGTYNVNLGSTYAISEQWDITGTVGGRFTKSENLSILGSAKSQSQGFLLNAGLSYKGEQLSGQLNLSRSLMPSNRGQLQEQNRANFSLQYQVTERLHGLVTASYQLSNRSATDNENSSRENIILQPTLHWKLSQEWTVSGGYRYRNQKITGSQDKQVESNLFMLTIHYNWQGLSLSR